MCVSLLCTIVIRNYFSPSDKYLANVTLGLFAQMLVGAHTNCPLLSDFVQNQN